MKKQNKAEKAKDEKKKEAARKAVIKRINREFGEFIKREAEDPDSCAENAETFLWVSSFVMILNDPDTVLCESDVIPLDIDYEALNRFDKNDNLLDAMASSMTGPYDIVEPQGFSQDELDFFIYSYDLGEED